MQTDPILSPLNEAQREAVLQTEGPSFILAGAGSGKTRALTHRIAFLISKGVEPWQILAVTFTNKAANEMKERVRNLLQITAPEEFGMRNAEFGMSGGAKLPTMGTFHSVCARILRRDIEHLGRDRSFVIYDGDDQEKLVKEILKEMKVEESELKPRAALSYIGRFKSEAVNPAEAKLQATSAKMQLVINAYAHYEKALRTNNALDFDDLMLETVRLFHETPKVLERYQRTWRYLLIDEYQDTNHAQYLFVTMLAKGHGNLCVIGDPDQSIYSFRGADIRNILEFKKDYPAAVQHTLDRNYRSTQMILTAADAVIAANPNRPAKKMWTDRTEGPKVVVNEVHDERAEAEDAVRTAIKHRAEGMRLNEQVILYRTNAQSRLFEEACMRAGIPYRIIGGTKFYLRREIKDVLAYLHVILNPGDALSLLRVINVPSRKIGGTTLEHLQAFCRDQSIVLWEALRRAEEIPALPEATAMRLKKFSDLIVEAKLKAERVPVTDLTRWLLDAIGMEKWLRDDTDEGEDRWSNIEELLSVMRKYDQLDPQTSLLSFLEEASLVSEVDKLNDTKDDALTLMTLHLCKGLEFEAVTIAGCEEGIFPHSSSSFDPEQLEEERRIMYVGMTRAKTHLRLLLTRSRMLWGETRSNAGSRFLDDLPESVTERRSDDILSAFAWSSRQMTENEPRRTRLEPFRQNEVNVEFNQDLSFAAEDENQEALEIGARVSHSVFGEGTVIGLRGDIATVRFDSGKEKTLALSIAPLRRL
ncbi:MAG: UvrD-helicase domain-containing protein [Patescibacteria group bacterium]